MTVLQTIEEAQKRKLQGKVRLIDIAIIERAKKGKRYPAGSIFFPISAVSLYNEVKLLKEVAEVDGRNVVATPQIDCVPEYFHIAASRSFPAFIERCATTINLQFDVLKDFTLYFHFDKERQQEIIDRIAIVDREIEIINKTIEMEKELKKWFLEKMFVS